MQGGEGRWRQPGQPERGYSVGDGVRKRAEGKGRTYDSVPVAVDAFGVVHGNNIDGGFVDEPVLQRMSI